MPIRDRIFDALAQGADALSYQRLMAWPKLVASIARGEIGEAHVKNFFRQAHRNMNHGRASFDAFKVFIGLLNAQLDECYAPPELSLELGECTKNAITVTVSIGRKGTVTCGAAARGAPPLAAATLAARALGAPGGMLACACLLYTSPSPRDGLLSRMPSSA